MRKRFDVDESAAKLKQIMHSKLTGAVRYLNAARQSPGLPVWAVAQLDSVKAASSVGVLDQLGAGVTVDGFEVTTSYIDFLQTQVNLAARGPDHATAQARAIASLTPLVGRRLARVMIAAPNRSGELRTALLYLSLEASEPVYWEYDS